MDKITLGNILSGFNLNKINDNFQNIQDTINNNLLGKSGDTLQGDLDVNGKYLYNLPAPSADSHPARLKDVQNAIAGIAAQTANLISFSPTPVVDATTVQGGIEQAAVAYKGALEGVASSSNVPAFEYAGALKYAPIQTGGAFSTHTFTNPVAVDMQNAVDVSPTSSGVLFRFGATGLTGGSGWSQDNYSLRNLTVVGGTPEVVTFEPWTGLLATVDNVRIMQNGDPSKYAINFKQQNWWPLVTNNVFADFLGKQGNFCKAVDDEGDSALRYSGNSRVVFSQNRLKWLALSTVGGVGFYGAAVGNKLRDNAMEGAKTAVIFGAPSAFSTVDGLYTELPFGDQVVVQLGDSVAAPNNTISLVSVKDVYANMHGFSNNRFIEPGNTSVVVNDLTLDRLYVNNLPANPQPLVRLNDLPGQKVRVGHINADDAPLVPLLATNYVAVIDRDNAALPPVNGDMVYADMNTVSLTANTQTAVARNWYAKSTQAGTYTRSASGTNRRALRQARYLGAFTFGAGATNTIAYELPRAVLYEGEVLTVQCLLNSSINLTHTISISILNSDNSRSLLKQKTVSTGASWSEHTLTFYVDPLVKDESAVLVFEVTNTTGSAANVFMTSVRFNRGAFGLCGRADTVAYDDTQAKVTTYPWISP